ncbi:sensor histidine kinase with PAS signal sensor domains [Pedobacter sp. BAL39]|uniref:PAS domain S-box protein n=1 Tax=Pedobacter sp. BAL39 TaxID=391596 RepID=UPI00015594E2|nr:PAS domain S-box protein [Pedobacter sp. BAL39]EDM38004.1 sensor histidine kinase with PAS signal sensor domains [Pedobacter sp. BAL39]
MMKKGPSVDTLKALESAPSMFLVLTPDLYILTASDLYLEATENTRELIVGRHIFDAFPNNPELPDADGVRNINASLQEVIRTKKKHVMKIQRYDVPDLSCPGKFIQRYWDPSHTPILDEDGDIQYIIQLATNVTDQVLTRRALDESRSAEREYKFEVNSLNLELDQVHHDLKELNISLENNVKIRTQELEISERKYRDLIEQSPVAMQVFRSEEMTFEIVNESMLKFLGKTADIIGKPLVVGVPEIKGQPIVDVLYGVYRTGVPLELRAEEVFLEKDGQLEAGYYDVLYRPLYDGTVVTGVLGIAIDVTPQIKFNLAIQESETRFRTMAEGCGIMISTIDLKGNLDYMNGDWLQFTGKSLANMQESGWEELIHPEDYEKANGIYIHSLEKRKPFATELRLLDAEGQYRWLRHRGSPRFNADESFEGYICSSVDFTEEKQRLLEIEYINKALMTANQHMEEVNTRLRDSEENLQSAFNAGELGSCSLNLKTGKAELSARYRSLFGLPLSGELSWEMVISAVEPEFVDDVILVMENARNFGHPIESTYAIRHLETGERRWMRVVGKVRPDDEGNFSDIYAVVMDVTVQKQDEHRKNDFIAMVSHELKTPITSVQAYLQILERNARAQDNAFVTGILEKSVSQIKKMTTMIDGFLNVSRLESGKIFIERKPFDMAGLLKESEEESKTMFSSHHIIYAPVLPMVIVADRNKIGQVINNLMSNAVKYAVAGSSIWVKCEYIGGYVQVSVKDEGMGIAQEEINKLFDRYFRSRYVTEGNISGFGIGLYLSAEIIQRHGGKIWAESELGKGSTFYFTIPL